MVLNITIDTESREDTLLMGAFGIAMRTTSQALINLRKENEEKSITDDPTEEKSDEATPTESSEEKKPKRQTRKKKEESKQETPHVEQEPVEAEAPTTEEVAKAAESEPQEESQEESVNAEYPSDNPSTDADVEPVKNEECTTEEWRSIMTKKLIELGIIKDESKELGANARLKDVFYDYVHRLSADYGDRIPSKLTNEQRYRFVQQFKTIHYNNESKTFELKLAF